MSHPEVTTFALCFIMLTAVQSQPHTGRVPCQFSAKGKNSPPYENFRNAQNHTFPFPLQGAHPLTSRPSMCAPSKTDDMEANQAIQQRITATICHCGKIYKNTRGLKIHQACMKCQVETSQRQRTGVSPGETQETQGWEAHHSAQFLQAEAQVPQKILNMAGNKIKWPAATDK